MGPIRDFLDQISVHFWPKMYWNLIWKSPGFVPFRSNMSHFRPKSDVPSTEINKSFLTAVLQTGCYFVYISTQRRTQLCCIGPYLENSQFFKYKFSLENEWILQVMDGLSLTKYMKTCGMYDLMKVMYKLTKCRNIGVWIDVLMHISVWCYYWTLCTVELIDDISMYCYWFCLNVL